MRWLLALFAAFPLLVHGGVITRTLDFQDNPPELRGHLNFDYGGLRFSPSCRISPGHHESGQIWLQSDHDNDNCTEYDGLPINPGYLGSGSGVYAADFYVDRHGKEFSLLEIAGTGFYGTEFIVKSSKGGVFHGSVQERSDYVLPWKLFELTGDEWRDITWFTLFNELVYHQPHQGWDDIKYSYHGVPEPPTWALVGLPIAGIAFRKRFAKFFHWRNA